VSPLTDDLEDIEQIPEHINASGMILLFLSRGYFLSRACLVEIAAGALLVAPSSDDSGWACVFTRRLSL
jgi:hypothetical protein